MKKKIGLKALLASVLVTLALVSPAVVLSLTTPANIEAAMIFEGAEIRAVGGDIQLIFAVSVDRAANTEGGSFFLEYNPEYLIPSDYDTNMPLWGGGELQTDSFFRFNPSLMDITDSNNDPVSPFQKEQISYASANGGATEVEYYSTLDTDSHIIHMELWLDQRPAAEGGVLSGNTPASTDEIQLLKDVSRDETETRFVLNKQDSETSTNKTVGKVTLGYLSFQIADRTLLPEIIRYFNHMECISDHSSVTTPLKPRVTVRSVTTGAMRETFLLDITEELTEQQDPWQIGAYSGQLYNMTKIYYAPDRTDVARKNVADEYRFEFEKTIVDVRATEPDFTINAYQNFTHGDMGDLALSMGRYSPTVTVTYADGTQENMVFPWGQTGSGYTVSTRSGAVTPANYDPTAAVENDTTGTVYYFVQNFVVSNPGYITYFPVTARMRVTPIHVLDVTAQDLERSYIVDEVLQQVSDPEGLKLPKEAQIITDVVPGGVSLVTPIKGWKPVQPASAAAGPDGLPGTADDDPTYVVSTWPQLALNGSNAGKVMNDLKADSYVMPGSTAGAAVDTEGKPYWPDSVDQPKTEPSNAAYAPGDFIGTYTFETSNVNHTVQEDILKVDIQAAFPWLTVPLDQYPLQHARRHIVSREDYLGPETYVVSYTSTVTEPVHIPAQNGDGQPTLTLSVERADGMSMSPNSVFRVWLPNGLELGTGIGDPYVADSPYTPHVNNWFNDPLGANPAAHVHGYYKSQPNSYSNNQGYFDLITNPDEPTEPLSTTNAYYGQERETLRRYINLGGWYYVAICEEPKPAAAMAACPNNLGSPCPGLTASYSDAAGGYVCDMCGTPVTAYDADAPRWTEPIPVYVPPRRNEYQENKIYNFIAENAGLFNWPGGVGSTITLPHGTYTPVAPTFNTLPGATGLPLYNVGGTPATPLEDPSVWDIWNREVPGVIRWEESYGVRTTYDAQTGAQPGILYTIKVDETDTTHTDDWTAPQTELTHWWTTPYQTPAGGGLTTPPGVGTTVWRYGPTPLYPGTDYNNDTFRDGWFFSGFGGWVGQPERYSEVGSEDPSNYYKATLRREWPEVATPDPLKEGLTLTSDSPTGITRVINGDFSSNVVLATYDDKQVGYTTRQEYVFTLTNTGDVDIYGLQIDGLTDGYVDDPIGGRFVMLQPPADFLAAGESTTFILTYVYDLKPVNNKPFNYRDTLYVTSNAHPTGGAGGDYHMSFDAEFTVTPSALHRVTVIYKPENGTMGTAGLVVGEQDGTLPGPDGVLGTADDVNGKVMTYTPTTRTYTDGDKVYVVVNLVDEYAIDSITITDSAGNPIPLPGGGGGNLTIDPYTGTAELRDKTLIYVFDMPDQDVIVTVNFYEPILSKLRLDDLIDFSAPCTGTMTLCVNAGNGCTGTTATYNNGVFACDNCGADVTANITSSTADLIDGFDNRQNTDPDNAYYPLDPGHIYKLWQKEFKGKEVRDGTLTLTSGTDDFQDALDWSANHSNDSPDFYLMTQGSAIPADRGGNIYNSSVAHYLVVIDSEDGLSQIRATLRNVKFHEDFQGKAQPGDADYAQHQNGYNDDIAPSVTMEVYYEDQVRDNWTGPANCTPVYNGNAANGYGPYDNMGNDLNNPHNIGSTELNTIHTSSQFDSPEPGHSAFVHIRVTYTPPGGGAGEIRHYYVEIHRRTDEPDITLHYGNSPYGMIMNESKFIAHQTGNPSLVDEAQTAASRNAAKAAFLKGYTFRNAAAAVMPTVVTRQRLDLVTYWREAWVKNTKLFEAESLTGFIHTVTPVVSGGTIVSGSCGTAGCTSSKADWDGTDFTCATCGVIIPAANVTPTTTDVTTYPVNPNVYDEGENLDLNDYAFFATLGESMWEPGVIQAKDSSGRTVPLDRITAAVLDPIDTSGAKGVTLLDTAAATQVGRFTDPGSSHPVIDLGVAGRILSPLAEHQTPTPATSTVDTDLGVKQWPAKKVVTTTTPAGGGDPVTTTSYVAVDDIRPGRYTIRYSYTDYDGTTQLTATRPFVILRGVGDVDANGVRDSIRAKDAAIATTATDEYILENRVTDPLGYTAGTAPTLTDPAGGVYPFANIFKFRVCDVNNDRNVNNIDGNLIDKNCRQTGMYTNPAGTMKAGACGTIGCTETQVHWNGTDLVCANCGVTVPEAKVNLTFSAAQTGNFLRFYHAIDYGRPGTPTIKTP